MYDEVGKANEVGEEVTGEDFFDASSLAIKCLIIKLFIGLIFVQETYHYKIIVERSVEIKAQQKHITSSRDTLSLSSMDTRGN